MSHIANQSHAHSPQDTTTTEIGLIYEKNERSCTNSATSEFDEVEQAKFAGCEQDAKDLTRILPASQKVYIQGSQDDIRVPFREITLTDTPIGLAQSGKKDGFIKNEPILVYDTSGVYTDPTVQIDLNQGLPNYAKDGLMSVMILKFWML